MLAARVHNHAPSGPLSFDEVEPPPLGPADVLIKVEASSINPVDWKVCDGILREHIPLDLPFIPGGDVAGTIALLGSQARGFAVGDQVYAMAASQFRYACGAFAQYCAVPADQVAPKPVSLNSIAAATVPTAALTAWQALHEQGRLTAGERVLIHAAAGGVGGFAVQFARLAGAYVIGTASAANRDYVLSLGANEVIDYQSKAFEEATGNLDLVIDLVGGDVQLRSLPLLRAGGRLVNAWGPLALDAAVAAGVMALKVAVKPNGAQLRHIGSLIDERIIATLVSQVFDLAEIDVAFALSRRGHGRGKIAVRIADS